MADAAAEAAGAPLLLASNGAWLESVGAGLGDLAAPLWAAGFWRLPGFLPATAEEVERALADATATLSALPGAKKLARKRAMADLASALLQAGAGLGCLSLAEIVSTALSSPVAGALRREDFDSVAAFKGLFGESLGTLLETVPELAGHPVLARVLLAAVQRHFGAAQDTAAAGASRASRSYGRMGRCRSRAAGACVCVWDAQARPEQAPQQGQAVAHEVRAECVLAAEVRAGVGAECLYVYVLSRCMWVDVVTLTLRSRLRGTGCAAVRAVCRRPRQLGRRRGRWSHSPLQMWARYVAQWRSAMCSGPWR